MNVSNIVGFYKLIERLSSKYNCPPEQVKILVTALGEANAEMRIRAGKDAPGKEDSSMKHCGRSAALRVLGLNSEAAPTRAEVTRRYRSLAKVWHPDKLDSNYEGDASARFLEIKAAADFLLAG